MFISEVFYVWISNEISICSELFEFDTMVSLFVYYCCCLKDIHHGEVSLKCWGISNKFNVGTSYVLL